MKKALYTLGAVTLSMVAANAYAQSSVTEDWAINTPFEWSDYSSTEGVEISGATATVQAFCLNVAGLPVSPSGGFTPIILSNGGKVKFFDNPDAAIPSEETWSENDQAVSDASDGWSWSDLAGYQGKVDYLPFDWVISGTGNEIYLDSYCEMRGTITGEGDVTIYVSNRSKVNFQCGNAKNDANKAFAGTIYFKSLDGYTCDTITVGTEFRPGDPGVGVMNTKTYKGSCTIINLEGMSNVVWNQTGANSQVVPNIAGACEIRTGGMPYINGYADAGNNASEFAYNATWTGGTTSHSFEYYGNGIAFNGPINQLGTYFYVRSSPAVYFNSAEPSLSQFVNSFSQRGTGITGGTGWADIYANNAARANIISAGYPYDAIGEMTWRGITLSSGNVVRIDFEGDKSDVLNVTETFQFFSGRNDINLGLSEQYFLSATPGKYKVINATTLDAGYSTVVDTIGYQVWDNNGCTYVVRSVKGGEQIVSAATGETFTAQPGDSIGVASFSNLASKYGATCMDGNRPYYVIKEWGVGSYTDGKSTDNKYIGSKEADYDGTYAPNAEQIGVAGIRAAGGAWVANSDRVADSLAWEKVWADFVAAHPVSDSRERVSIDDGSVIPGTVGDSVFVTYSYVHTNDGISGGHNWNNANANASYKTYPYAGAKTYTYYYYSNNTLLVKASGKVRDAAGDSISAYTINNTMPAVRYAGTKEVRYTAVDGSDSIVVENDPATAYESFCTGKINVPQVDGTAIRYWFDFTAFMTDGIIALCYEKVDAEGNITETNANALGVCTDETLVNDNQVDIQTVVKEHAVVKSRQIYTLDGKKVNDLVKGFNLVKTEYTDGSVRTVKMFVK